MALFKKNQSDSASGEVVVKNQTKAKKKKDGMSTVLSESVVETVLEEMRNNKPCVAERDGEDLYVGLMLDTNDIGGLNKKSRRDEDKGSVIECMNSGRIKTYITPALMDEDKLIIVPDLLTVDAMDEFGILTEAPYHLAYVQPDGSIEATDIECSFKEMVDVVSQDGDVMDLLADKNVEWALEEDEPEEAVDPSEVTMQIPPVVTDGEEEDIPELEDEDAAFADDLDEPDFIDEVPTGDDFIPEDDEFAGDDFEEMPVDDNGDYYDDGAAVDEEEVFSEEQLAETVTRVFHDSGLGLEVTTEPFDAQFVHTNTYVPFDEERGEGWLAEYVSNMAKDANTELRRMHQDNLMKAREMYYRVISGMCERIGKDLDENDPDTDYGKAMKKLQDARQADLDALDRKVSDKKQELEADWNKRVEQSAQDAANAARQQYRERFGRQHDEALFRIEPTIKAQIEDDFRDMQRDLYERRRSDASKRLDYAETEALREVSEVYLKAMEEEQATYAKWRDAINAFIDENRKEDIAHDKVLAEELAQSTKADAVMAEYTAKLNAQTQEFEARSQALRAEIEADQRKMAAELADKEMAMNDKLSDMRDQRDSVQAKLDELIDKYAALDAKKEAEYNSRINELSQERESWIEKCDNAIALHKRTNIIAITLSIIAVVAALAIGCIIGIHTNLDFSSGAANQAITQEFNDRMDEVEKQHAGDTDKKETQKTTDKSVDETPVLEDAPAESGE